MRVSEMRRTRRRWMRRLGVDRTQATVRKTRRVERPSHSRSCETGQYRANVAERLVSPSRSLGAGKLVLPRVAPGREHLVTGWSRGTAPPGDIGASKNGGERVLETVMDKQRVHVPLASVPSWTRAPSGQICPRR